MGLLRVLFPRMCPFGCGREEQFCTSCLNGNTRGQDVTDYTQNTKDNKKRDRAEKRK